MYSTSVYNYIPRQIVLLYSGNSPRRYYTVYAKNLKLHKGVDNIIQFQFLNQEQKPVDITGIEITFRLLGANSSGILLQKALVNTLPATGICELRVLTSELLTIDSQMCSYSLEIPYNNLDMPVFVSQDANARGTILVVDSVLPAHELSGSVNIPTHPSPSPGNQVTFYSGVLTTDGLFNTTIQPYFTDYTGSTEVQGSTTGTDWYNISNVQTYTNNTGTTYYNLEGFHPFIRMKFVSTGGSVDQILTR